MRLMECIRLRVQDVDFEYQQITVRSGKGNKDRVVPVPLGVVDSFKVQLSTREQLHREDLESGFGAVFLPDALERKYPNAAKELRWQYIFPSGKVAVDPRSGQVRRHRIHESMIQKAVRKAAVASGIQKKILSHTAPLLCNPFAGVRIRYTHCAGVAGSL